MAISFLRVDDRVIHGQIVIGWSRSKPCDGIIAVDDGIAKDPILSMVYKNAAPVGVKATIFTVDQALAKLEQIRMSKKNYFVICKTPITFQRLIEGGADFGMKKLNIGPMSTRKGTTVVGPNVSATEEEFRAFEYLHDTGIEIEFQLVPDVKPYTWPVVRK